jgi:N-acetylneuraminic acid mutarotase
MKALPAGLLLLLAAISAYGQNSGTWVPLAPLPTARQELATGALNGKVYVIGGYDVDRRSTAIVEVYDPATNTWSRAHDIPRGSNHNAAAVAAGKLYSLAGDAMHVYDPTADSWTEVAAPIFGHNGSPAVGVFQDKIYVAGGSSPLGSVNCEVYDPATNTWTALASMSVPRHHTGGGFVGGKFYVVGGRTANTPNTVNLTAVEAYDPQSNTWEQRAPMPTGRSGIAVAAFNGELFVFGGETVAEGVYNAVEAYNPVNNTWRAETSMPEARHGIFAAVIGNKVYIPGGGSSDQIVAPVHSNHVFIISSPSSGFANISTRGRIETGDKVLIGGLIVTGTGTKRILVRALGPSVPVPGALGNPQIQLFNGSGQSIAVNDDWKSAPNGAEIKDSTLAPPNDLEAAILATVSPGSYTAVVSGVNGATGVGLVEVYDLEGGPDSRLANISTRGFVQTGDDVLIGGLILNGQIARKIIVRAIGPSLARADALADPTLELRNANGGLLAENNNWRTTQEAEIIETTVPPSHDLESAIVTTLAPAAYTAILRGVGDTTGIALVEAYALQ